MSWQGGCDRGNWGQGGRCAELARTIRQGDEHLRVEEKIECSSRCALRVLLAEAEKTAKKDNDK